MQNPNKIPYDDNADYAAEEWFGEYSLEPDLPKIYELERYSYEEYLENHKRIINSGVPLYSFQNNALSNLEFTKLKETACQRCKEIATLNDAQYLEAITKLFLNPIQLYTYEFYENDTSTSLERRKLNKDEFEEIQKQILNNLISENSWWPDVEKQKRLLDQMIPGSYFDPFYNVAHQDASEKVNEENESIEFLKKQLLQLENEQRYFKDEKTSKAKNRLTEIASEIEMVKNALKDFKAV